MAKKRTAAEWTEIVSKYKQSGQTQATFCRENGISPKTFSNHLYPRTGQRASVVTAKKRSTDEWAKLIEDLQSSGMERSAWCLARGISEKAMRTAMQRQQTVTKQKQATQPVHEWAELRAKEPENLGSIKIRSGGLEIEIAAGYPAEDLILLLERLVRAC